MPNNVARMVGVTGGIGSGKSAVCAVFSSLGRIVISADRIGREISNWDETTKGAIRKLLGDEAYGADGMLRRTYVAERVFSDSRLRKGLEKIIHPGVFRQIDARVAQLTEAERSPYVIVEAALIYETGMDKRLDAVVVVDADEETRIARIIERDGVARSSVVQKMRAQLPQETKKRKADFVIKNGTARQELEKSVKFVDFMLCSMFTDAAPPHS